ncbi:endothelin-converting enzyme 1 [Drosophila sulfurigaster albostrigata]|uniref:endothelin-converting enzyme 1 n=1 Tax=Drosophila sulfurigaster albostrigata TaxID=89887 RepID=UPI002D21E74F|nr:endothelin-converting enzyme 1 [Drosophila sulfurigaster albostrigata]
MMRIWGICLLLASVQALPTKHLNHNATEEQEQEQELEEETSHWNGDINLQYIQRIESYMQPEQDACHDFHAYACGNWKSVHGNVSTMSLSGSHIDQRYVHLFERLLREPQASEHRLPMFPKLLRYYQSCLALDKPRLRHYLDHLPPRSTDHWMELLAILGRYGHHEHYIRITVAHHNASRHIIFMQAHVHELKMTLTPNIYFALRRHLDGDLPSLPDLRQQFKQLDATLYRLSQSESINSEEENFKTYTLNQLQQELPGLNWTHALQLKFNATYDGQHQVQVDELPQLRQLIDFLNQADARLLRLYSLSRFLQYLLQLPHNPLNNLVNNRAPSSVECVQHMRKTLYLGMNYAYEHIYYAKQRATDERIIFRVFEELKAQFSKQLRLNEFGLDANLLSALQQKVSGMAINIGNMPHNASEQFFREREQLWQATGDFYLNHFKSLLEYNAHQAEMERTTNATLKQLFYSFSYHGPSMQDNIDATPYFYCVSNIIIMPYAYVQLPFYHAQFWPALLYGDLGNTLGHEMLHTLDSFFVDFDAQGVQRDYGDQLRRYRQYVAGIECLNSTANITLNERTADFSGTRLALHTYLQTPMQRRQHGRLYFLQFAQFFCGQEADESHDEGSVRLNYTLSQMPEFAEVFNCTQGTPMNPVERCRFW